MHKFISPRIQIIHASNILVVDDYITDPKTGNSKNIIVGDLSMEGVKEAFEKDQKAQQKALLDNKLISFIKSCHLTFGLMGGDKVASNTAPIYVPKLYSAKDLDPYFCWITSPCSVTLVLPFTVPGGCDNNAA